MPFPFQRHFDKLSPRQAYCGALIIVWICAAFVFFYRYDQSLMYWDENYHLTSALRYLAGIAQFENHPPLGKLFIALGEWLFHPNNGANIEAMLGLKITHKVPVFYSFTGLRFFPTLFAIIGAGLFFVLLRELTQHSGYALIFSALYVLENTFIVHFRATHLDAFQMTFVLAALAIFVRGWRQQRGLSLWFYAGMALFLALAFMVKVNSAFLAILLPLLFILEHRFRALKLQDIAPDFVRKALLSLLVGAVVVYSVFAVHLALGRNMPNPKTKAGEQDIAAMSPPYRDFLQQHRPMTPYLVAVVTRDYFKFWSKGPLSTPKRRIGDPTENGSSALTWPLMDKTITYRWFKISGVTTYVQLAGNVAGWGMGLFGVLLSAGIIISRRILNRPAANPYWYSLIEIYLGLYALFMALHLYLGSLRVMYLYHYFMGLLISHLLFVLCFMYMFDAKKNLLRFRAIATAGIFFTLLAAFYYVSPLTYEGSLTQAQCAMRSQYFSLLKCIPD